MKKLLFLTYLLGYFSWGFAQEESLDQLFKVDYDTPLTLDLNEEKEEKEVVQQQKKKVKKNVFFGLKTRKGYTRNGFGQDIVWEQFRILKEPVSPPPYARDFYWFDHKKKRIVNSLRFTEKSGSVLHGPYKKMLGEQVLEEGYYYQGMKHKRWIRFNRHDILVEKAYWWKGWPQESRIAYYDFKKTKIKEVIPIIHNERHGEYWAFHEDGSIAVQGSYKFDYRVGLWKEFYDDRRVKREVSYSSDPFDFDFSPKIIREWDRKGNLIYDREKFLKAQR